MKEYFVANIRQASLSDKVEVKSNLEEYLPEIEALAASTLSGPTSVFTSTLSALDLPSVYDDIDALTSALSDVSITVPAASSDPATMLRTVSVVEEPLPVTRLRTGTTADERGPFLVGLEAWFVANVGSIKPSKRKEYAQLFYDSNLTTETRILTQLTRNPKWLSQHYVDEFDAEDILAYLRTKGLPSTAPPTGSHLISFICFVDVLSLSVCLLAAAVLPPVAQPRVVQTPAVLKPAPAQDGESIY